MAPTLRPTLRPKNVGQQVGPNKLAELGRALPNTADLGPWLGQLGADPGLPGRLRKSKPSSKSEPRAPVSGRLSDWPNFGQAKRDPGGPDLAGYALGSRGAVLQEAGQELGGPHLRIGGRSRLRRKRKIGAQGALSFKATPGHRRTRPSGFARGPSSALGSGFGGPGPICGRARPRLRPPRASPPAHMFGRRAPREVDPKAAQPGGSAPGVLHTLCSVAPPTTRWGTCGGASLGRRPQIRAGASPMSSCIRIFASGGTEVGLASTALEAKLTHVGQTFERSSNIRVLPTLPGGRCVSAPGAGAGFGQLCRGSGQLQGGFGRVPQFVAWARPSLRQDDRAGRITAQHSAEGR